MFNLYTALAAAVVIAVLGYMLAEGIEHWRTARHRKDIDQTIAHAVAFLREAKERGVAHRPGYATKEAAQEAAWQAAWRTDPDTTQPISADVMRVLLSSDDAR